MPMSANIMSKLVSMLYWLQRYKLWRWHMKITVWMVRNHCSRSECFRSLSIFQKLAKPVPNGRTKSLPITCSWSSVRNLSGLNTDGSDQTSGSMWTEYKLVNTCKYHIKSFTNSHIPNPRSLWLTSLRELIVEQFFCTGWNESLAKIPLLFG